jgi:hypothetical protein
MVALEKAFYNWLHTLGVERAVVAGALAAVVDLVQAVGLGVLV